MSGDDSDVTDDIDIAVKDFANSKTAWVWRMMYGGRISIGTRGFLTLDDCWCYDSVELAVKALEAWDGDGEPTGWKRHPASGRRRPEGDESKEYVYL